jgi:EAL domain-containing protein (putative c-di-GMP-specific phosphodiesterase class I)
VHPERGVLPPSEFQSAAEDAGLMPSIDRWVLEEACRQARSWQNDEGTGSLFVHVNVSAALVQRPGLAHEVAGILHMTGLEAAKLVIEITETTLVRDPEAARRELTRLHNLGVRLALDDFGTGFSSLSHLLWFPIDMIKVDRSFVAALGRDDRSSDLLLAVVNLGRTLGLDVVAEGIEGPGQGDYLRSIGCRWGQGYHFARPLPPADLIRHLVEESALRVVEPPVAPLVALCDARR